MPRQRSVFFQVPFRWVPERQNHCFTVCLLLFLMIFRLPRLEIIILLNKSHRNLNRLQAARQPQNFKTISVPSLKANRQVTIGLPLASGRPNLLDAYPPQKTNKTNSSHLLIYLTLLHHT